MRVGDLPAGEVAELRTYWARLFSAHPLTIVVLAIPALVVACGGERFAIPQVNLLELVRIEPGHNQQIERISRIASTR